MTASAAIAIDDAPEFFAPANSNAVDLLIGEYRQQKANIERVAEFMAGEEMRGAASYFFEGSRGKHDRYPRSPSEVFQAELAIKALNATYWQRALKLTDVLDYMPDKRRNEWFEQIQKMETPDFEEETVHATLADLLAKRLDYLAEMVDGIFSGLSHEHVTNTPEGFRKRMIIGNVYGWSGYADRNAGLIHDLRCVIAKFMGRDTPFYSATRTSLDYFRRYTGQWNIMDGGALRIRVYKKGTAHLEVHPDMAYRLNQILSHLHPAAIPSQYRRPPSRKELKDFKLINRPIPFAVLEKLYSAKYYKHKNERYQENCLSMGYDYSDIAKHLRREIENVIESIGGTYDEGQRGKYIGGFMFDYDAEDVIKEIIASGVIPDQKSHQFYPTPERLAKIAVEMAEIGPEDSCLEPSAGHGGLAELMPVDRALCVEISKLNCSILKAKGFQVQNGDFIKWAKSAHKFDRIVMNPPFSEGRWKAHIEAASGLLLDGGRLVAILPASAVKTVKLDGFNVKFSRVYRDEFVGTSIEVVIMTAERMG